MLSTLGTRLLAGDIRIPTLSSLRSARRSRREKTAAAPDNGWFIEPFGQHAARWMSAAGPPATQQHDLGHAPPGEPYDQDRDGTATVVTGKHVSSSRDLLSSRNGGPAT